jgi:hypothetical protein
MEQFEKLHQKYLPKVNRGLVIDLFLRLRENPNDKPMYTIETFREKGTNSEEIRNDIIQRTGIVQQKIVSSFSLISLVAHQFLLSASPAAI